VPIYALRSIRPGQWAVNERGTLAEPLGLVTEAEPGPFGPRYRAVLWAIVPAKRERVGEYNDWSRAAQAILDRLGLVGELSEDLPGGRPGF
jgi:hypothetical protein